MIASLTDSLQTVLLVHLGALACVWALIVGAVYWSGRVLLSPSLPFASVVQSTSLVVGIFLVGQMIELTLPHAFMPFLSQVLFPALYLLVVLYLFFRAAGRYLVCAGLSVPSMTRSTIVFVVFSLVVLGAATIVSRIQLEPLNALFSLTMDYLKYILLCACVVLEYKSGSCVIAQQMPVVSDENDHYASY